MFQDLSPPRPPPQKKNLLTKTDNLVAIKILNYSLIFIIKSKNIQFDFAGFINCNIKGLRQKVAKVKIF